MNSSRAWSTSTTIDGMERCRCPLFHDHDTRSAGHVDCHSAASLAGWWSTRRGDDDGSGPGGRGGAHGRPTCRRAGGAPSSAGLGWCGPSCDRTHARPGQDTGPSLPPTGPQLPGPGRALCHRSATRCDVPITARHVADCTVGPREKRNRRWSHPAQRLTGPLPHDSALDPFLFRRVAQEKMVANHTVAV
jgi:hypothetical protein